MNIFNLFRSNQNQGSTNKSYKSDYPENVFTNDFSNEIKDEKNYKMQKDYVNPNNFSNPLSYNDDTSTFNQRINSSEKNNRNIFGNFNLQSLLPLLINGNGKKGITEMLTNSNPEMATMLNILSKSNKKSKKSNSEMSSQEFNMSAYIKCSEYFKK